MTQFIERERPSKRDLQNSLTKRIAKLGKTIPELVSGTIISPCGPNPYDAIEAFVAHKVFNSAVLIEANPDQYKTACKHISDVQLSREATTGPTEHYTLSQLLMADIRNILSVYPSDIISIRELARQLSCIEGHPWFTISRGERMTSRMLSIQLRRSFNIRARLRSMEDPITKMHTFGSTYEYSQFHQLFQEYIPPVLEEGSEPIVYPTEIGLGANIKVVHYDMWCALRSKQLLGELSGVDIDICQRFTDILINHALRVVSNIDRETFWLRTTTSRRGVSSNYTSKQQDKLKNLIYGEGIRIIDESDSEDGNYCDYRGAPMNSWQIICQH